MSSSRVSGIADLLSALNASGGGNIQRREQFVGERRERLGFRAVAGGRRRAGVGGGAESPRQRQAARKAMPSSAAAASAPPLPNGSEVSPQCGQT